jgi:hypothetical protein
MSQKQKYLGPKRSEMLKVLAPRLAELAKAGTRWVPVNGPDLFVNTDVDHCAITGMNTPHGFYIRVDHDGRHVFTGYENRGRMWVATWKRGEWENEILDAHRQRFRKWFREQREQVRNSVHH